MAPYFTRTIFLIKELVIYTRVYKWLAVKWLVSRLRRYYLTIVHIYFPKLFKRSPTAEVYLALNDPYSFMLVQVLAELNQRFNVNFKLYMTHGALLSFAENKRLWRNWALKDANNIAKLYTLNSLEHYPSREALATGQQLWQILPTNIENAKTIFEKTWADDFEDYYLPSTPVITHQVKNLSRQIKKGQELPASIYCLGEWFLGVDSLEHFEKRLNDFSFNIDQAQELYQKSTISLKTKSTSKKPSAEHDVITAYLSIRSPYSYLGFMQAKQLSEHYQVPLKVKFVLPLLMRGVGISANKQRYIFLDAYREAQQRKITFTSFKEPIGQGVFNCYQTFAYAEQQHKSIEYVQAVFEAVFVDGIDLGQEQNIRKICQQIDLNYDDAQEYAEQHNWQATSDLNQQELTKLGYWGVPCFEYQNQHCWGQDRLWQIEQQLIKS